MQFSELFEVVYFSYNWLKHCSEFLRTGYEYMSSTNLVFETSIKNNVFIQILIRIILFSVDTQWVCLCWVYFRPSSSSRSSLFEILSISIYTYLILYYLLHVLQLRITAIHFHLYSRKRHNRRQFNSLLPRLLCSRPPPAILRRTSQLPECTYRRM